MPSEQPAGFLGSIDQLLFNSTIQTAIQALFLVGAVLMLLGVAIVAVYVWRNFQIKWLYKVGLEAALFFVGIDLGITAYETSYIVHIVHDEKVQITRVSQKLDILSKKLEAQITQETSLKLEALSKTVQETSQTVQDLSQKFNDLTCPPQKIEKTACRQKTCRSDCASKTSLTVPPSQSESNPVSPASSTSLLSHPAELSRQADGWVYVGTGAGLEWDEKYFNWDDEQARLPETGDILTATGSVHLRMPLGCQAPIVGAIAPGERVHVLRAQTVADCHHWVQVKRMRKRTLKEPTTRHTMPSSRKESAS